jgi:hypothetical protein
VVTASGGSACGKWLRVVYDDGGVTAAIKRSPVHVTGHGDCLIGSVTEKALGRHPHQ